MTPDWQIRVDGEGITQALEPDLVSVAVSDAAGGAPAALVIQAADTPEVAAWAHAGAEVGVGLGYTDSGLIDLGIFVIDEVSTGDPPQTLSIGGSSIESRDATVRILRQRAWNNRNVGQILQDIAAEIGYGSAVSVDLVAEPVEHWGSDGETVVEAFSRLARAYSGIPTVEDRCLVISRRWSGAAPAGILPVTILSSLDLTHWSLSHAGGDSLEITMPGRPQLGARFALYLIGFDGGENGVWIVDQVEHRIDNSGFVTQISALPPAP